MRNVRLRNALLELAASDTIPLRTILSKAGGVAALRALTPAKATAEIRRAASTLSRENKKAGKVFDIDKEAIDEWVKNNTGGAHEKNKYKFAAGERYKGKVVEDEKGNLTVGDTALKHRRGGGYTLVWERDGDKESYVIKTADDIKKIRAEIQQYWSGWVDLYKEGHVKKRDLNRAHDDFEQYVVLLDSAQRHFDTVKPAPKESKPAGPRSVRNVQGPKSPARQAQLDKAKIAYDEIRKNPKKLDAQNIHTVEVHLDEVVREYKEKGDVPEDVQSAVDKVSFVASQLLNNRKHADVDKLLDDARDALRKFSKATGGAKPAAQPKFTPPSPDKAKALLRQNLATPDNITKMDPEDLDGLCWAVNHLSDKNRDSAVLRKASHALSDYATFLKSRPTPSSFNQQIQDEYARDAMKALNAAKKELVANKTWTSTTTNKDDEAKPAPKEKPAKPIKTTETKPVQSDLSSINPRSDSKKYVAEAIKDVDQFARDPKLLHDLHVALKLAFRADYMGRFPDAPLSIDRAYQRLGDYFSLPRKDNKIVNKEEGDALLQEIVKNLAKYRDEDAAKKRAPARRVDITKKVPEGMTKNMVKHVVDPSGIESLSETALVKLMREVDDFAEQWGPGADDASRVASWLDRLLKAKRAKDGRGLTGAIDAVKKSMKKLHDAVSRQ